MMKAPTKTEIPANTSKNVEKPPTAFCTAFAFSSASCLPVIASTPAGRTLAIRSRSSVWDSPATAATLIEVNSSGASSTRCAVGVSKAITVAPPTLSCPDTRNVPTRV